MSTETGQEEMNRERREKVTNEVTAEGHTENGRHGHRKRERLAIITRRENNKVRTRERGKK